MSHELARLLLTEVSNSSVEVLKKPVYALFLDAKAAYDRVLRKALVRNIFLSGVNDQRLVYLDERLMNCRTYCDFNKVLMGPILDNRGLEQGGISSSDHYKLYNNEQSSVANLSDLGASLNSTNISCISLADDSVLLSNSIINLRNLLYLTTRYCAKYDVELVPDKTALLAFIPSGDKVASCDKEIIELSLHDHKIPFVDQTTHLGVVRTVCPGNMAAIVDRMTAHRRKVFAILPAGLALHHHANTCPRLRIEKIYCLPVLLSGLASLPLSKSEVNAIDRYYKTYLCLMKLHECTPDSAVFFLAGTLPAMAHLHLRQLSLFSMICHLNGDHLHTHAKFVLVSWKLSDKSWFNDIRQLCLMYRLPHPLHLLESPMAKTDFRKICMTNVTEYWHQKFTSDAAITSLKYLKTSFLSLSRPHPIWTSLTSSNPYQAKSARIQALFLSGRYRTEKLARFWSSNTDGSCLLEPCCSEKISDTVEHILVRCPALDKTRRRLEAFTLNFAADKPYLLRLLSEYLLNCTDDDISAQFLVDCSILPNVISAYQQLGSMVHEDLFRITRTWCRSLHVDRIKLLGRYDSLK